MNLNKNAKNIIKIKENITNEGKNSRQKVKIIKFKSLRGGRRGKEKINCKQQFPRERREKISKKKFDKPKREF